MQRKKYEAMKKKVAKAPKERRGKKMRWVAKGIYDDVEKPKTFHLPLLYLPFRRLPQSLEP